MANKKKPITYHDEIYPSVREFCEAHNITPATIYNRKRLLRQRGISEPNLEQVMNFKKKPRILAYGSHPDPTNKSNAFIEWFSRLDDPTQQNKALSFIGATKSPSQRFNLLKALFPYILSENARAIVERQMSRFNNN